MADTGRNWLELRSIEFRPGHLMHADGVQSTLVIGVEFLNPFDQKPMCVAFVAAWDNAHDILDGLQQTIDSGPA